MLIFIKMRKEIFQEIEVPEGMEVEVKGNLIKLKENGKEIEKKFDIHNITIERKKNKIIIGDKKATKNEKKVINTIAAHIKNMIKGVREEFKYNLKVCSSHFPITVEVEGSEIIIKNFLGEKVPRKTKIVPGADVKVERDTITITSPNKESAGQTAANLEKATWIRSRDRRIFQDGIFITNKAGKSI